MLLGCLVHIYMLMGKVLFSDGAMKSRCWPPLYFCRDYCIPNLWFLLRVASWERTCYKFCPLLTELTLTPLRYVSWPLAFCVWCSWLVAVCNNELTALVCISHLSPHIHTGRRAIWLLNAISLYSNWLLRPKSQLAALTMKQQEMAPVPAFFV